jgi:hypothetical protein
VLRPAPVLRVFGTARLLLHEDPDPGRVAKLRDALRRDRMLRNPPIVAPMADGRAVVLDGANRVTALREIGARQIAAQVVSYDQPEIVLSTWCHYIREEDPPPFRERLRGVRGVTAAATTPGEADRRLQQREGFASVTDAQGTLLLRDRGDPVAAAEILNHIVGLYRGRSRIYRVDTGDIEALRAEYGPGTLIVFLPFNKEDILLIAERGGRLPTGITRHIIPGRALRLNVPLEWLIEGTGPEAAQARLDAAVDQRWQDHGVRYYAEPTFLFDE